MKNTDLPNEQEKQTVRLEYSTPVLEVYGDLTELTHGGSGAGSDAGGTPYQFPGG